MEKRQCAKALESCARSTIIVPTSSQNLVAKTDIHMCYHRVQFQGMCPVSNPSVSDYPGIYSVLAGLRPGPVKLLYIGETSREIDCRIRDHETKECWKKMADYLMTETEDRTLWFTTYKIHQTDLRKQIEAALIFQLQPPCNIKYRENFPLESIKLSVSGCVSILNINLFEVETDDNRTSQGPICDPKCYVSPPCAK